MHQFSNIPCSQIGNFRDFWGVKGLFCIKRDLKGTSAQKSDFRD